MAVWYSGKGKVPQQKCWSGRPTVHFAQQDESVGDRSLYSEQQAQAKCHKVLVLWWTAQQKTKHQNPESMCNFVLANVYHKIANKNHKLYLPLWLKQGGNCEFLKIKYEKIGMLTVLLR